MKIPDELYYTEDHEWGKTEDGMMRVGITDYAQNELGDIVFVDLFQKGTSVSKGDAIGTVESVKAVSDVLAPVDGEIVEVNGSLEDAPELVNQDCYEKGWMVVLKMDDPSQTDKLMDSQSYEEYLKAEAK
jgi:glycine cleavage system H protein